MWQGPRENAETEKLGTFPVKGEGVYVCDPYCHGGHTVHNVLKGDWIVVKVIADCGWGRRPVELFAYHEDHGHFHEDWQVDGSIGVDAATVAIGPFECMSGYGDGLYPVEIQHHGDHVTAIRVTFITDEGLEEEEDLGAE